MNDLINTAKNPHTWRQRFGILGALSQLEQSRFTSISYLHEKINNHQNQLGDRQYLVRQSASAKAEQIVAATKAKAEQESVKYLKTVR